MAKYQTSDKDNAMRSTLEMKSKCFVSFLPSGFVLVEGLNPEVSSGIVGIESGVMAVIPENVSDRILGDLVLMVLEKKTVVHGKDVDLDSIYATRNKIAGYKNTKKFDNEAKVVCVSNSKSYDEIFDGELSISAQKIIDGHIKMYDGTDLIVKADPRSVFEGIMAMKEHCRTRVSW